MTSNKNDLIIDEGFPALNTFVPEDAKNEKDPYISKDLSILKYSVPEFISNNRNLMNMINEMKEAEIDDGGAGAFYIFLKKNKSTK